MQQHAYHRDTTNTIVETRAQRAHGSQAGNNLQSGETSDDPQEEALAIVVPQQPIMAAPPPVNPAPPARDQAETTRYWIGQLPPIPNCITRPSQHLTTSSTEPWRSS